MSKLTAHLLIPCNNIYFTLVAMCFVSVTCDGSQVFPRIEEVSNANGGHGEGEESEALRLARKLSSHEYMAAVCNLDTFQEMVQEKVHLAIRQAILARCLIVVPENVEEKWSGKGTCHGTEYTLMCDNGKCTRRRWGKMLWKRYMAWHRVHDLCVKI